jgi:hypothetical protein
VQRAKLALPQSIADYVIVSKGPLVLRDRASFGNGSIGVSSAPATGEALVVGNDAQAGIGHALVAPSIRLGERARTGDLFTDRLKAPQNAVHGSVSAYQAPPAIPEMEPFVPGSGSLTVAQGTTSTLASGDFGDVTVRGVLRLSGGTYELKSLTLDNDARVEAQAATKLRIQNRLVTGDRSRLTPSAPLAADALKVIVASSHASAVVLGHDHVFTGLLLAPNGGVEARDRVRATGAVAGGGASLGGDTIVAFAVGFACSEEADCDDGLTCTVDACSDAECSSEAAEEGTECGGGSCDGDGACVCLPDYEGDNCETFLDADADGVGDSVDNCPETSNARQQDPDLDGLGSACDNCDITPNPEQEDADEDLIGDVCDDQTSFTLSSGGVELFKPVPDRRTIAFANNPIDLPFPTATPGGTASFSPFTFEGQELVVFNYPMGMQADDLGGANLLGPFSSSFGWPFLPGFKYSSLPLSPGQSDSISYAHETSHVVRYMHGTCARRIPLEPLYQQLADTLLSTFICTSLDEGHGLIRVTRRFVEVQPHFRGEVGLAPIDEASVEMGVSFSAQFDARQVDTGAGVTVGMNPGYAIRASADGGVEIYIINNAANVQVINDSGTIADGVRVALRETVPATIAAQINDALVVPLPDSLATECDPTSSAAPMDCYTAARDALNLGCVAGSNAACTARDAVEPRNFTCPAASSLCAFKPVVQEVNVLPDSLELVFAPRPIEPGRPLNEFFRSALPELAGFDPEICEDITLESRIDADVPSLQLGLLEPMGAEDIPPIPCDELATE